MNKVGFFIAYSTDSTQNQYSAAGCDLSVAQIVLQCYAVNIVVGCPQSTISSLIFCIFNGCTGHRVNVCRPPKINKIIKMKQKNGGEQNTIMLYWNHAFSWCWHVFSAFEHLKRAKNHFEQKFCFQLRYFYAQRCGKVTINGVFQDVFASCPHIIHSNVIYH